MHKTPLARMRVLLVASDYPHPGQPYGGIFNERCAVALREICDTVEVLAPRPFAPPLISYLLPRWRKYSQICPLERRNGIRVVRPSYVQIPRLGSSFFVDQGAFWASKRAAREMHRKKAFDVILSFNLAGAGGLAWRLGKELQLPSSGWATGGDVRVSASSSLGQSVIRTLQNLDLVFYQSRELLQEARRLVDDGASRFEDKHLVLARGIPLPPNMDRLAMRQRVRRRLKITDEQTLVLTVGRVCKDKGVFELAEAIGICVDGDSKIKCVVLGSVPGFDETESVMNALNKDGKLINAFRILPACEPRRVWEFYCAADVFAFPSHHEGMPNSLLEAMSMGLPAVGFGIPPVLEIDDGSHAILIAKPFEAKSFAEAVLKLSSSEDLRKQVGKAARKQVMSRFMIGTNMSYALDCLRKLLGE